MTAFLTLLVALLGAPEASALDRCISTTGSNTGNGVAPNCWQTFEYADSNATDGDNICAYPGDYQGFVLNTVQNVSWSPCTGGLGDVRFYRGGHSTEGVIVISSGTTGHTFTNLLTMVPDTVHPATASERILYGVTLKGGNNNTTIDGFEMVNTYATMETMDAMFRCWRYGQDPGQDANTLHTKTSCTAHGITKSTNPRAAIGIRVDGSNIVVNNVKIHNYAGSGVGRGDYANNVQFSNLDIRRYGLNGINLNSNCFSQQRNHTNVSVENAVLGPSSYSDGGQTNGNATNPNPDVGGGNNDPWPCLGGFRFSKTLFIGNMENGLDGKNLVDTVVENSVFVGHTSDDDGPWHNGTSCGSGGALMHGTGQNMGGLIVRNSLFIDNAGGLRLDLEQNGVYNNAFINNRRHCDASGPNWTDGNLTSHWDSQGEWGGLNRQHNSIYATTGGLYEMTGAGVSDGNVFISGRDYRVQGGSTYSGLAAWQANTTMDDNSVEATLANIFDSPTGLDTYTMGTDIWSDAAIDAVITDINNGVFDRRSDTVGGKNSLTGGEAHIIVQAGSSGTVINVGKGAEQVCCTWGPTSAMDTVVINGQERQVTAVNHPEMDGVSQGNGTITVDQAITVSTNDEIYIKYSNGSTSQQVGPHPELYKTGDPIISNEITVTSRITSDSDDAEEDRADGSVNAGSSFLDIPFNTSNGEDQYIGLRFLSLNVPQGKLVKRAVIELVSTSARTGAETLYVDMEDSDNAPAMAETTSNISARTYTSSTSGALPEVPASETVFTTHNIKVAVQEVINRQGWSANNAMLARLYGDLAAANNRVAKSHENSTAQAALLSVTYDNDTQAPTLNSIGTQTVEEQQLLTVAITSSSSYGTPTLSADFSELPGGHDAQIVDAGNGTGTLTWTPAADEGTPFFITVRATDPTYSELYTEERFQIDVTSMDPDQPPTLTVDDISPNCYTSSVCTVTMTATEFGGAGCSVVTADTSGLPVINDNSLTGPDGSCGWSWTWAPADGDVDVDGQTDFSVTFTATSPNTLTDDQVVSIDVQSSQFGIQSIPIAQSYCDTEEDIATGVQYPTSQDLEMHYNDGRTLHQLVGLCFEGLAPRDGATILNAYIQFAAVDTQSGAVDLELFCESGAPFSGTTGELAAMSRTGALVNWSPAQWDAITPGQSSWVEAQRTPRIATPIQEIVNAAGWQPGDTIRCRIAPQGYDIGNWNSDQDFRRAYTFDTVEQEPILHLQYAWPTQETATVETGDDIAEEVEGEVTTDQPATGIGTRPTP